MQGIFILIFAADIIAFRDNVGGFDHRHEDRRGNLQYGLVDRPFGCPGTLHRDALHPACHNAIGAIAANMVGRHGNGLHAGGAEAVDRRPGRCLGQASEKRGIASDIGRSVRDIAHQAIIDKTAFHARFCDRMFDRMRRHRHRRGDVEATAARLGEPGAGIRNNDSFAHDDFPSDCVRPAFESSGRFCREL